MTVSLEQMDCRRKSNDITFHKPVAPPLPVKPIPTFEELVSKIMNASEGAQISCPPQWEEKLKAKFPMPSEKGTIYLTPLFRPGLYSVTITRWGNRANLPRPR